MVPGIIFKDRKDMGVVGSRRLETVKYSVTYKVPVVCSGGVCV